MSAEEKIIHTTGRSNCGGRCVIHVSVKNGKITGISTECDRHNGTVPLTACKKGMNYDRTFLSEDRLKYPMKRVGERGEGRFERISWEEAVDMIASEWIRIRDTYGPLSRYVNYATGVDGVMSGRTFAKRLLALDGGYLDYYNSYSTACIAPATELMYGTKNSGHSPKDWLNSNLIILNGHNPAETHFDSVTMYYLRKAKEKEIPIIVIDPRKNDTVSVLNAEWIPIRPGTDAALFDAMAYVILTENLLDREFLDRCCIGFDRDHMPEGSDPKENVTEYLLGTTDGIAKTPAWAETITEVPREVIGSLARRYAKSSPAALIQGYGAQRHYNGEQSARGAILLACMTGNVGIPGGWASGDADIDMSLFPYIGSGENPTNRKIPSFLWTDAVLRGSELSALDGVTGGDGRITDVKMILNLGGNCLVNQHGDINRTIRILKDTSLCEFIVCSDLFLTSSAMFADLVLPGISFLEGENMTIPWKYGNFIGFTNKVAEPLYEGRFEYDWLAEVAEKLGLREELTKGRSVEDWLRAAYEETAGKIELPPFEVLKKEGIVRFEERETRPAFEKECRNPEAFPFPTESGKIELYSARVKRETYPDAVSPLPGYLKEREGAEDPLRERYPLQLIGWHTKRRCHSMHDNTKELISWDPQRLWMNPQDAKDRGISDGDEVLVYNDRGRVGIPVLVTDRIMQGVTALSQGSWYRPGKDGTDHGGNINVLTSSYTSPLSKGNTQHSILVEVVKYRKEGNE